jgi:hypothetical protein
MLSESVYGRAWHAAREAALGPELVATTLAHLWVPKPMPPGQMRPLTLVARPSALPSGQVLVGQEVG